MYLMCRLQYRPRQRVQYRLRATSTAPQLATSTPPEPASSIVPQLHKLTAKRGHFCWLRRVGRYSPSRVGPPINRAWCLSGSSGWSFFYRPYVAMHVTGPSFAASKRAHVCCLGCGYTAGVHGTNHGGTPCPIVILGNLYCVLNHPSYGETDIFPSVKLVGTS